MRAIDYFDKGADACPGRTAIIDGESRYTYQEMREVTRRISRAMRANGFRIIDPSPRMGSRGTTVFFVHPKSKEDSPFGILIEIVEAPESK